MSPRIEFVETEAGWRCVPSARKLARDAIKSAAEESGVVFARGAEATVHLVGDAEIKEINARWRNKNAPTNVLSFPAAPASKIASARLIGDVFVSLQTLQREAAAEDKLLADHFRHLVLHGFLHLLGYDHETAAEAEAMEAMETRALARLGVPDPYAGAELADAP
jgi:probable rRNA maturation factor